MTNNQSIEPLHFVIKDCYEVVDFERVTHWLAKSSWIPGVIRASVERSAKHSAVVISAFNADNVQIAFARVVSDCERFASITDVIVDQPYRGQGVGRAMVRYALNHSELATVRSWTPLYTGRTRLLCSPRVFPQSPIPKITRTPGCGCDAQLAEFDMSTGLV